MDISKMREGNQLTILLSGELNTATAPDLEMALADEVKADDTIIFDMTDLTYMTSAGLRILVACNEATGRRGAVILRGVCDEILEVLEMTGFDTVLTIE
jgi:anti-sigma B factor antagonist